MAKGRAGKIPAIPGGRNLDAPASGGMLVHRLVSSLPEASTEMKKKPRMPRARMLITTVKRIVASMPMMLIQTNTTQKTAHHATGVLHQGELAMSNRPQT